MDASISSQKTEKMASSNHYSPAIDAFLVSALYHEARRKRVPMTQLVDELLEGALEGSEGWKLAQTDETSLAKRRGGHHLQRALTRPPTERLPPVLEHRREPNQNHRKDYRYG